MTDLERIKQLDAYCSQWRQSVDHYEELRNQLLKWQEMGMRHYTSDSEEDLMPTLIREAENAIQLHKVILCRIESLREKSINI